MIFNELVREKSNTHYFDYFMKRKKKHGTWSWSVYKTQVYEQYRDITHCTILSLCLVSIEILRQCAHSLNLTSYFMNISMFTLCYKECLFFTSGQDDSNKFT